MRPLLLALTALALAYPVRAETLDKGSCQLTGEAAARDLESATKLLDRLKAFGFVLLIKRSDGELQAAAEGAAIAQTRLMQPLQEYVQRLEDVTYQLRRCGRSGP